MTETVIQELTLHSADDTETLSRIYAVCDEIIVSSLYDDLGYTDTLDIKPLHWNYCLTKVCDNVFKNNPYILHDIPNINNAYNKSKINSIYKIYKDLSYKYSQEITMIRFTYFAGIERETLYAWSGKAKLGESDILQKIRADGEESLSNMLSDRSINSLGVIAKLNHIYEWRDDSKQGTNITVNVSDNASAIGQRYHAKLVDSKPEE